MKGPSEKRLEDVGFIVFLYHCLETMKRHLISNPNSVYGDVVLLFESKMRSNKKNTEARILLQNIILLVECVLDKPYRTRFVLGRYGPYSEVLTDEASELVAMYSSGSVRELSTLIEDDIGRLSEALQVVARLRCRQNEDTKRSGVLAGISTTDWMMLLGTTLLYNVQNIVPNKPPMRPIQIVKDFRSRIPFANRVYTRKHVTYAWKALKQEGLIQE